MFLISTTALVKKT